MVGDLVAIGQPLRAEYLFLMCPPKLLEAQRDGPQPVDHLRRQGGQRRGVWDGRRRSIGCQVQV